MMPHPESMSHNACYRSIPHFDCSYWISIDRGDFPVTDIIGEFSIIDEAFQVDTRGTHLQSDRVVLRNYAIRRVFVEFERYLPSHLENVPHSFAVLNSHFTVAPNQSSVYNCRCYFNDIKNPELPPLDFDISLAMVFVKGSPTTTTKKEN